MKLAIRSAGAWGHRNLRTWQPDDPDSLQRESARLARALVAPCVDSRGQGASERKARNRHDSQPNNSTS